MKRRQFLKAAGLGVAAAGAVAAPAIAQSMPEVKWRLTASWPKSLDTLFGGADDVRQGRREATDDKFQIQTFAAGEIVPRAAGVRRRVQRHRRDRAHRLVLLFRQGPDLRLRHVGRLRPEPAAEPRLVLRGRRQRSAQRVLQEVQRHDAARRQHRLPDGRLVPQGDQHASTTSRASNSASAASPGRVIQKLGGVPQLLGARDIYPALEKGVIDAAEWVGPYDDEKLGFYKVAKNYYYAGLVGRRVDARRLRQPRQVEFVAEELPGHSPKRGRLCQRLDDREIRRAQSAGAQAADRQRRQAARVLAGDHGGLLEGGA